MLDKFRIIVVVRRPGQRFHLGARLDQTLTRYLHKGLVAHCSSNLLVQEYLDSLPEFQGGGIQVAQGPEALLLAVVVRLTDEVGHQQIEHIQGIIHRDDFESMGKGEQGGQPSLWGHAHNGLGACRGTIAGEIAEPIRRQRLQGEMTDPEGADVFKALSRGH